MIWDKRKTNFFEQFQVKTGCRWVPVFTCKPEFFTQTKVIFITDEHQLMDFISAPAGKYGEFSALN